MTRFLKRIGGSKIFRLEIFRFNKMCCAKVVRKTSALCYAGNARFLTMQKSRSVKVLVRCLELLTSGLSTNASVFRLQSPQHITDVYEKFLRSWVAKNFLKCRHEV